MNTKKYNMVIVGAFSLLFPLFSLLLTGCSTDEDFFYQDEPRVRLVGEKTWAAGTDSVTFSFVTYPQDTIEKTIYVDAQIMGEVADRDRTVNITVDAEKTTAATSQYVVPQSVTVPSGQASGRFAVVLKRDASLETKTVRLYLKVAESADFKVGVNEENHISFIWNDILSKPKNWDELESFFGAYSNVKYRFMLLNMRSDDGELSAETMSWAKLNSLKIRFQNALDAYNAAHPGNPLTDENGNLVTF
ncbi:MAG: DUF4843 domain-containing protein [Prevotella sp.]|nr:DUF4843 domain-containing protein [Prevotella sp.]